MADQTIPKRRVRSVAEARALVVAWKASGQNKEAWCRSQGILRSAVSVIGDVLDLAKIESGNLDLAIQDIDIRRQAAEIKGMFTATTPRS